MCLTYPKATLALVQKASKLHPKSAPMHLTDGQQVHIAQSIQQPHDSLLVKSIGGQSNETKSGAYPSRAVQRQRHTLVH
ncbi:hypothetical protein BpHYR1_021297 [Brachionus plicatilis]|uniref:Uncharacterized protein n=1 Tax=Brachionus plicatilis TaxID=10195 RepID=A0A3M7SE55_BRAPC|nr:hypothetical protein BpHYR1_021297 [Brachionus plicatilis]